MNEQEFKLKEDYIELSKLIKFLQLAESGSHAKLLVEDGQILVDGKTELRKRAKLRKGQVVQIENQIVKIT